MLPTNKMLPQYHYQPQSKLLCCQRFAILFTLLLTNIPVAKAIRNIDLTTEETTTRISWEDARTANVAPKVNPYLLEANQRNYVKELLKKTSRMHLREKRGPASESMSSSEDYDTNNDYNRVGDRSGLSRSGRMGEDTANHSNDRFESRSNSRVSRSKRSGDEKAKDDGLVSGSELSRSKRFEDMFMVYDGTNEDDNNYDHPESRSRSRSRSRSATERISAGY